MVLSNHIVMLSQTMLLYLLRRTYFLVSHQLLYDHERKQPSDDPKTDFGVTVMATCNTRSKVYFWMHSTLKRKKKEHRTWDRSSNNSYVVLRKIKKLVKFSLCVKLEPYSLLIYQLPKSSTDSSIKR